MKLTTIESINEDIKKKEAVRDKLIELMEIEYTSLNDEVLYKYIQVQNVAKVANYLNEKGFRLEGNRGKRKYISNDISEIIMNKDLKANEELKTFSKTLFLYMKGKTYYSSLVKISMDAGKSNEV